MRVDRDDLALRRLSNLILRKRVRPQIDLILTETGRYREPMLAIRNTVLSDPALNGLRINANILGEGGDRQPRLEQGRTKPFVRHLAHKIQGTPKDVPQ